MSGGLFKDLVNYYSIKTAKTVAFIVVIKKNLMKCFPLFKKNVKIDSTNLNSLFYNWK